MLASILLLALFLQGGGQRQGQFPAQQQQPSPNPQSTPAAAGAQGGRPSTDYDASEAAIRPPYTSTMNNYVRSELGYKTDLEYYILGGGIGPWNWGTNNNYVDTSTALRNALAKNPFLKIFVAMGYYDMATPYYAVDDTLNHISIDPRLLKNFSRSYYEAGHMMYIDEKSLTKLHSDVNKFMQDSMSR